MNDIRKFWLENQDGEIWKFTDKESKTFMDSPKGLGLSNVRGGFRLGNAEVINYVQNELLDITGTLYFYGDTRPNIYQKYFDFMKFISKNMMLKLHYQTPNSFDSFYKYCSITSLEKTEIDKDRLIMACPVVFSTQTFWRNDNINTFIGNNKLTDGTKDYYLERPYHYSSNLLSKMKIINRGNADTSMKITINGYSSNPTISIYDNNNIKYGAIRMIGTFDKVIVDSDDLKQNIQLLKNGAWLTSPYAYQDLNVGSPNQVYVTFVKLKPGESKITFSSDDVFNGEIIFEWSDEYVSV